MSSTPRPPRPWALLAALAACDAPLAEPVLPERAAAIDVDPERPASADASALEATASALAAPTSAPELSPELAAWLRDARVDDDHFARRRLYTWTSTATADRLRRDGELFDDAQLPEGPTAYVQRLEHLASSSAPAGRLAKVLLGHPDLRRRRYAWVRPWATRLGVVRPYGDQLVEVVLRPDAILGRFDPSRDEPWAFRDLDDRPVPLARVLADPSRVGAIFHVLRDGDVQVREYVLCNPAAIESWSLATPHIAEVLAQDARFVRELAALADAGAAADEWPAHLAFVVDHYAPTPRALFALADALAVSIQVGAAVEFTPHHKFDLDADLGLVQARQVPARFLNVV